MNDLLLQLFCTSLMSIRSNRTENSHFVENFLPVLADQSILTQSDCFASPAQFQCSIGYRSSPGRIPMNFDVPFGTVGEERVVAGDVLAPVDKFFSCCCDKVCLYMILAWWMFGSCGELASSGCAN